MATYLLGSAPLKYALTVSVNAAATGRVSCAPIVKGLGPLEEPATEEKNLPLITYTQEHCSSSNQ